MEHPQVGALQTFHLKPCLGHALVICNPCCVWSRWRSDKPAGPFEGLHVQVRPRQCHRPERLTQSRQPTGPVNKSSQRIWMGPEQRRAVRHLHYTLSGPCSPVILKNSKHNKEDSLALQCLDGRFARNDCSAPRVARPLSRRTLVCETLWKDVGTRSVFCETIRAIWLRAKHAPRFAAAKRGPPKLHCLQNLDTTAIIFWVAMIYS